MKKIVVRVLSGLAILFTFLGSPRAVQAHPWGGLVVDSAGRIFFTFVCPFVSDDHQACVWQLNPDEAQPQPKLTARQSPSDLILTRTRSRQLFAAERDTYQGTFRSQIWHIANPNTLILPPTTDPFQFNPEAWATDDAGHVYFTHKSTLYRRSPDGQINKLAGGTSGVKDGPAAEAQFEFISTMAWGPDSSLYFVDKHRLRKLTAAGNIETIASHLKEESPQNLPFRGANIIFDIAVDPNHNVYLAYFGNRRVLKVDASGEVQTFLESEDVWAPHGVDVFNGEVYILESVIDIPPFWQFWKGQEIRPRVRKVDQAGKVSTLFEYHI